MSSIKIALHNLGCKVNSYELDAIKAQIAESGWNIVPFEPGADVYVINTCTVTNIADRKTRQMIHKARGFNKNAVVVALGCYVDKDEELDPDIDIALKNSQKGDFIDVVTSYLGLSPAQPLKEGILPETHTRAFLKIQDGCNQFCSYCIIPHVRGRITSRSREDILHEAGELAKKGYKELVLTGIHISSYGKDKHEPPEGSIFCYDRLLELIRAIASIDGIERIRLGSLEPRIITREFVSGLSAVKEICPHFHLSLQSGSEGVLKRMNRHYTPDEYHHGVMLLREYFDSPAITTDIIVGFPGETRDEFCETLDFVRKISLSDVHIFKYSKRNGTKAAVMDGQLTEAEKTSRSNELKQVVKKCRDEYIKSHIGRDLSVLFEESINIEGKQYMTGHSKEYIRVTIESPGDLTNQILTVKGEICNIAAKVV